jgi:glycolate oxidase FAD binding subunit
LPSASELAERLRDGGPVRIAGARTKAWGSPVDGLPELSTRDLDTFVSHDPGDFTAVLEPGVPLAEAQARFAEHDQMLALDPPDGDGRATVGGVVASADSGPMRHRYGAPRDLVIGVALALPDGTVARAGGRVIKNVAGYDLSKLAAGSFGTLGVIAEVCVRLHPRPAGTATAVVRHDDPVRLQQTALALAARPIEAEALDVRWGGGEGAILARFGGAAAADRAAAIGGETVTDDEALWAAQRAGQRAGAGGEVVLRVAGLPAELARVLAAAREHCATAVGRAGVGTTWLTLPAGTGAETVRAVRSALAPHPVVVTDAPAQLRAAVDPWGVPEGPELELMRRVKQRFDPDGRCNPGIFAGGI